MEKRFVFSGFAFSAWAVSHCHSLSPRSCYADRSFTSMRFLAFIAPQIRPPELTRGRPDLLRFPGQRISIQYVISRVLRILHHFASTHPASSNGANLAFARRSGVGGRLPPEPPLLAFIAALSFTRDLASLGTRLARKKKALNGPFFSSWVSAFTWVLSEGGAFGGGHTVMLLSRRGRKNLATQVRGSL